MDLSSREQLTNALLEYAASLTIGSTTHSQVGINRRKLATVVLRFVADPRAGASPRDRVVAQLRLGAIFADESSAESLDAYRAAAEDARQIADHQSVYDAELHCAKLLEDASAAEAEGAYQRAIDATDELSEPGLAERAKLRFARFLSSRDPQRARSVYEELVADERGAGHAEALAGLAILALERNELAEARALIRRAEALESAAPLPADNPFMVSAAAISVAAAEIAMLRSRDLDQR